MGSSSSVLVCDPEHDVVSDMRASVPEVETDPEFALNRWQTAAQVFMDEHFDKTKQVELVGVRRVGMDTFVMQWLLQNLETYKIVLLEGLLRDKHRFIRNLARMAKCRGYRVEYTDSSKVTINNTTVTRCSNESDLTIGFDHCDRRKVWGKAIFMKSKTFARTFT